jgi:hypothetical protein
MVTALNVHASTSLVHRFAPVFVLAAAVSCGSRTSLPIDDAKGFEDSAAPEAISEASAQCKGRLQGWSEVDVVLSGDFESIVAAASADASGIWLAGGGRTAVRGETRLLRVEVNRGSPRIAENILLNGTEGWEPLAVAVAKEQIALIARGVDGEPWVALFEYDGNEVQRAAIEPLKPDWANKMEADVAWVGEDVVVAARRLGSPDPFVVERRSARLFARWSATPAMDQPFSFRLRPDGSRLRTRSALYEATSSDLRWSQDRSALSPIGAARKAWTGIDAQGFVLERDDGTVVRGGWPGPSWGSNGAIPVYESTTGVFIFGNVEVAPFIGWFTGNELEWIAVPHPSGGGLAVGSDNDVGAFFAGLEIPRSERPLRYWGCTR